MILVDIHVIISNNYSYLKRQCPLPALPREDDVLEIGVEGLTPRVECVWFDIERSVVWVFSECHHSHFSAADEKALLALGYESEINTSPPE